MTVLQGLIAQKFSKDEQLIELQAVTDLAKSSTTLHWYRVQNGVRETDHFASAVVKYGNASNWLSSWQRLAHLVNGRIASLEQMATDGTASVLPRNMAYRLFRNLVDYADKYRGMQSVIMNGYEAVANVTLTTKGSGTWTVPPYFIDSVVHLAGLIMNGSDASNTYDYFYVTPGWGSMRFAKPLTPGGQYRSYVQMVPAEQDGFWNGDVYILQDDEIVGLVEKITFRRFPRILLNKLFSPPDAQTADKRPANSTARAATGRSVQASEPNAWVETSVTPPSIPSGSDTAPSGETSEESLSDSSTAASSAPVEKNPTIINALKLIAKETNLEMSQLTDDASFANLGVDSLMSLALSEKFKSELDLDIKSSVFVECETVGELKGWIEGCC